MKGSWSKAIAIGILTTFIGGVGVVYYQKTFIEKPIKDRLYNQEQIDDPNKDKTKNREALPTNGRTSLPNKVTYMSEFLEPYHKDVNDYSRNEVYKVAGKEYSNGYYFHPWNYQDSSADFNLESKYSKIVGWIGLSDENNNNDSLVYIYGDNKNLAHFTLKAGSLPKKVNLNVKEVNNLNIKFKGNIGNIDPSPVIFYDMIIK